MIETSLVLHVAAEDVIGCLCDGLLEIRDDERII